MKLPMVSRQLLLQTIMLKMSLIMVSSIFLAAFCANLKHIFLKYNSHLLFNEHELCFLRLLCSCIIMCHTTKNRINMRQECIAQPSTYFLFLVYIRYSMHSCSIINLIIARSKNKHLINVYTEWKDKKEHPTLS